MAQEFHISVTPLGADDYLVRIEKVAPGVPLAEEQVSWPVEDWLVQARQLMNDPLLGVLDGNATFSADRFFLPEWDPQVSQSSLNLVALGQQLYNALFQGSLRDSWMMAQAIAQNQRQVLRLRLGLKEPRLLRLPWEVLHAGDRPLATGTDVAFSRYQLSTGLTNPPPRSSHHQNQPLKILMVVAGPSDQDTLELAQESRELQEELKSRSPNEPPAIQLTILEQPGREQLTQALEQGQYQVFHYAGHSNLGESGGDVYLVSNKTGLTETLNGEDLAGLLANNGVQLAVFNSCRGAHTAASDPLETGTERNLAQALIQRGIPGVLAMAERIPDEVALTLTRLFYRNLNQGYPIDLSLSRSRQGLMAAYGSNQLYWALPVLYLHPAFNGFLTNDTPQKREALFALPDPSDPSVDLAEDALFTPPSLTRPTLPLIPNDGNESDLPLGQESGEYDDEDEEDTSAFIRDLLKQLPVEPTNTAPTRPSVDDEPPPGAVPAPQELAATTSSAETTSWHLPQAEQNIQSNQPAGQKPRGLKRRAWRRLQGFSGLWMGLGATGFAALFLAGIWLAQNGAQQQNSRPSLPGVPEQSSNPQNNNLEKTDTSKVTTDAIEQFNQGNITDGLKAVEALLDREALEQAGAALGAVPKSEIENPAVSFLRGRHAWQSAQKGSKVYSASDARRYWETASKKDPKSTAYLTALGFAFYAEGDFVRANNAWYEVLDLMRQAGASDKAGTPSKDVLTTYAGLALGMRQEAQKYKGDKRENMLSESRKARQYVLSKDPVNFQPDALGKNWLWSEKAIRDWRSLLAAGN